MIYSILSGIFSFFLSRTIELKITNTLYKALIEEIIKAFSLLLFYVLTLIKIKVNKKKKSDLFLNEVVKFYVFLSYFIFAISENIFYFFSYPSKSIFYRFLTGFLIHVNTGLFFILALSFHKLRKLFYGYKIILYIFILIIINSIYHYLSNFIFYSNVNTTYFVYIINPILFLILIFITIINMGKNSVLQFFK